jgi:hypothetical protein
MRNLLLSGASVLALLTGLAGSASAATMSVYAAPNPKSVIGSISGAASNMTLDLPLFNSNLGTLNSVMVVSNLSASSAAKRGSYSWTSVTSSSTTTLHPQAKSTATITGGPSQLDGPASLSVTADGLTHHIAGGGIQYLFTAAASNSKSTTVGSPAGAWELAGGGIDFLTLNIATRAEVPNYINFDWPSGGPAFIYSLDVTYNYTPNVGTPPVATPEPASVLIIGAGLLGLGAARRRRAR